jgi:hypothetical protein
MKIFSILIFLSIFKVSACSNGENYKKAYIERIGNKTFIKLKGKRELMVHSPGSIFSNKTYEDSLLIQIPEFRQGVIDGTMIPVKKGDFSYKGSILIKPDYLKVNLFIDDTASKKLRALSWNGNYDY